MVVKNNIRFEELNEKEREQAMLSFICLMEELAEYGDERDIIMLNSLLDNEDYAWEILKTKTFYKNAEGDVFCN